MDDDIKVCTQVEDDNEGFICPRKLQEAGPWNRDERDSWREDGTCSFCGSLDPKLFFEFVEQGAKVTPTDKNYKAYVDGPMVKVKGAGKIYFQHFNFIDKHKFIDLLNSKKINLGYPGYFYRLPFFITLAGIMT